MKLTKCDVNEFKEKYKKYYKKSKWQEVLENFLESDMDCVKVEDYSNKDAKSCATALGTAIKRFHMTGVRSVLCDGEVYLIRERRMKED